ncbi:hypothetical protein ElyMa_001263800 [Elysia marginata]|uniref:Uncharacterized protein n=1 Tax=Elysia marginata TaxID=1093978 RepID=A0AAV4IG31_9GAST|nr:hypothetical protein ElyMa_001263800 [Elysia marginata]
MGAASPSLLPHYPRSGELISLSPLSLVHQVSIAFVVGFSAALSAFSDLNQGCLSDMRSKVVVVVAVTILVIVVVVVVGRGGGIGGGEAAAVVV